MAENKKEYTESDMVEFGQRVAEEIAERYVDATIWSDTIEEIVKECLAEYIR